MQEYNYVLKYNYFNLAFIFLGVWYALRWKFKNDENVNYLAGFLVGIKTSALANLIANFFLLIYLTFIDPLYMQVIIKEGLMGEYLSPITIAAALFIEQLGASVIMILVIMQLYKTRKNT